MRTAAAHMLPPRLLKGLYNVKIVCSTTIE